MSTGTFDLLRKLFQFYFVRYSASLRSTCYVDVVILFTKKVDTDNRSSDILQISPAPSNLGGSVISGLSNSVTSKVNRLIVRGSEEGTIVIV